MEKARGLKIDGDELKSTSFRLVGTQMPTDIGAYEAKTHLPALLERVARGERFTITKHGRPIARLVPVERTGPDCRREAIERLKVFREGQTLDVPVKQLINQGRR
jgi:prevent-host-death family protein